MRRNGIVVLVLAGVALGVLAEQQAYDWPDVAGWLPDLLAGCGLLGLGMALLPTVRSRTAGALLVGAGLAWFAYDFATTGPPGVQWSLSRLAYLHRGPLFALAFMLPMGGARSRSATLGVAVAWFAAVVWPVWSSAPGALAASAVLVTAAVFHLRGARGWSERSGALHGLGAVAVLTTAIAVGALQRLAGGGRGVDTLLVVYAASVLLTGAILFAGARVVAPGALAERAVLLERRGSRLRDVLRELLGDPSFEIVLGERPVPPGGVSYDPARSPRVTPVVAGGRTLALVTHAPTTLDDPATRAAVLSAVGLSAERSRLQSAIDRQIIAIAASRRRLVAAEDDERRRLAARLDSSVGAALEAVQGLVRRAQAGTEPSEALDRAALQLSEIQPELERLVAGLTVADETELRRALERLVVGFPLHVRLEVASVRLDAAVASTFWFVCSESLANAAKHAHAREAVVTLRDSADALRLEVADDGCGGADPRGSGLVGLADRLAALGGRLAVLSPPGGGTTVVAEIPHAVG